jgi:NAD(P)-dependent dehydrogenase (short-subunit alcohol dehydrogenase family)
LSWYIDPFGEGVVSRFRDKVTVVTGGGGGIGAALSRGWADRGAVVIVADVAHDRAERVAREIEERGGRASAAPLDVAQDGAVHELVDRVCARHGRLDFMVNNAGILVSGEFETISLDLWRRAVDVDLWGVVHGSRAAWPVMRRQGGGHIVNVASIFGLLPGLLCTPYTLSKFSVVGLGQALRAEGADHGIRVTTACPGFARTGLFARHGFAGEMDAGELERHIAVRFMEPDEVARRILAGVARNRGLLVFPASARLLWRLQRISPRLVTHLSRGILRRARAGAASGAG